MEEQQNDEELRIIPTNLEKKEELVSFRLDKELKEKIILYANKKGLSRSKAIREMLVLFLQKGEMNG